MGSTLLKSSEWYLTNISDPHLHIMKNALLVLRLRINHYATLIFFPISVTTCLTLAALGWLSKELLQNQRSIAKNRFMGTGKLLLTAVNEYVYSRRKMPRSSCLCLEFQMGKARQCPLREQFIQNRGAFLSILAGEPSVVFKTQTPMVVEES